MVEKELKKEKRRIGLWDIFFWIGMAILIMWIITKLFGIIKTPIFFELMPVITFVFFAGGFYQKVNDLVTKVDRISDKLETLESRVNNLDLRVTKIEAKLNL